MLRISSLPLSVSFTPSLYHHHLPALHLILCQCAPPPSRPPFLTRPPLCSPRLSSVHFAILFLSPSRHFKVGVIRAPSINVFIFFLLKKKKTLFPPAHCWTLAIGCLASWKGYTGRATSWCRHISSWKHPEHHFPTEADENMVQQLLYRQFYKAIWSELLTSPAVLS